ncbi:hypothetical protein BPAE_0071g00330 [Botrytis paeoniae]|uniref:Secreted protein n=1 Tax=Botrytis paeoniae TaxID=278948 RepID=A0A4Z1FSH2_9HELO|nr:hypothetical protein BPAE_0071g00330 [Botrytis paeoniae]
MQFLSIITILSFTTGIYAGCYTSGIAGSAANINSYLGTICNGLSGNYVKNEQRHQCVMDSASVQWDFTLEYIGSDASRNIGSTECISGMQKETACGKGGSSSYSNWAYTADPNAGSCYSISE